MKALEQIIQRSKENPRTVVLAEGQDPRIQQAAARAVREGIARIVLLGDADELNAIAAEAQIDLGGVEIQNPATSDKHDSYAKALFELRKHKGMTPKQADEQVRNPLCFANMMVAQGDADGCVNGAVYTTADVLRSALQVIGVKPSTKLVSSFFLMMLCEPFHSLKGGLIFSDCALVVDPDAGELAEIAMAAADSARIMLGEEPRVAMLSFSTSGSSKHPLVDKVVAASEQVKARMPGLAIDGDVQLDAAIVEQIAGHKVKDSVVKGKSNVLVFPNLEAGNIGYKMAERVGGAVAIGPLLQGLAKPANDLSRGCSADDVFNVIAVTVVQAQNA
ncbi:MAG: phosphate acetyltransferase [Gammaproteobacteria bacterium]|nr:phosphate acetyltransferase [Gammaproteobacteria bacterium]